MSGTMAARQGLTRAGSFGPGSVGSNRRDALARADWRFLLPRLDYERTLLVGSPPLAAIEALAATSEHVVVATTRPGDLLRKLNAGDGSWSRRVRPMALDRTLPAPGGSAGLAVVCPDGDGLRFLSRRCSASELDRVVADDGVLCIRTAGPAGLAAARRAVRGIRGRGFAPRGSWWTGPGRDEVRLAHLLGDGDVFHHLVESLHGRSWKKRMLLSVLRPIEARMPIHRVLPRRTEVLERDGGPASVPERVGGALPEYLALAVSRRAPGCEGGRPVVPGPGALRPGLLATGRYDANKVVTFLYPEEGASPGALVKMSRASRFNGRLEAEYGALTSLERSAHVDIESHPRALFLGHHAGLAILGESVVRGEPLRTRCSGDPDDPHVRAALDWIVRLGRSSSRPGDHTVESAWGEPGEVLERFTRVYTLTESERRFLDERFAELHDPGRRIPRVFEHGDTGTWNVLVRDDDGVAFLDWESSLEHGRPLFDLFYFMRSLAAWNARLRGIRDGREMYRRSFLEISPFSDLQVETTRRYCSAVAMEREAVEPVFYACWVHRALKEATWRRGHPDEGTYVNLLRLCIRHARAPGLRRLFT